MTTNYQQFNNEFDLYNISLKKETSEAKYQKQKNQITIQKENLLYWYEDDYCVYMYM